VKPIFTRRNRRILLIILAILALGMLSPGYSRVIVKGDGVDVDVQSAGFGPRQVSVKTDDISAKASVR
jgi:hypothetical protein